MEELHRLHKDVPFGWVEALRVILARTPAPRPRPEPQPFNPESVHRLAAPH